MSSSFTGSRSRRSPSGHLLTPPSRGSLIPPSTPMSLELHGKEKYTPLPFNSRKKDRRLLAPFRDQTYSQKPDSGERQSIWSATLAFLKKLLHPITSWASPHLPTTALRPWATHFATLLFRLYLALLSLAALYKLLQHALVHPLAELLLLLSPHLGYLIAAAALLALALAFSAASRHCAPAIRTALHLAIILYLLPRLLGLDDAALPALLKAALRWTWDMNALGAATARRSYFGSWAPPSPFHVRA